MAKRGGKREGAGRKNIAYEKADFERLVSQFYDEKELEKLKKKIDSKVYSVEDMFLYKALKGGAEAMQIFQKIYPDTLVSELSGSLDFKDINKKDILNKVKGLLNAKSKREYK